MNHHRIMKQWICLLIFHVLFFTAQAQNKHDPVLNLFIPKTLGSVQQNTFYRMTSQLCFNKAENIFENTGNGYMDQYPDRNDQLAIVELKAESKTKNNMFSFIVLSITENLYIWLGVTGFTVLSLIIVLLLVRHRLSIQKQMLVEQQHEIAMQHIKQLEQEQQLIATQAVLDGETAERSRMARDLHDNLGGLLSVVKLNLKHMENYSAMDIQDINRFNRAFDMLDQSIDELRRVAHHMMPESLIRYGLRVSLDDFCRAIPGANFQYVGEDTRLDSRLEAIIYHCAYELVNNAVKHAHATTINIQLMIDEGLISLSIHDNGTGYNPSEFTIGTRLEKIHHRLSAHNGKMTIYSTPDSGTEISIEVEKPTMNKSKQSHHSQYILSNPYV